MAPATMLHTSGVVPVRPDGEVPAAEDALLVEIARGLEISPAEYRRLVSPMGLARVLEGT